MNNYQIHDALVKDYQEASRTVQRFRMQAFGVLFGMQLIFFCLKHFQIQNLNLISLILFGGFFLSRLLDFNTRRNLDLRMSEMTLSGLNLERNNPRLENFFHQVLERFGIIRIMLLRVMFDFMALYLFANAAYRVFLDYNPAFDLSLKMFYPVIALIGFFMSDLYGFVA